MLRRVVLVTAAMLGSAELSAQIAEGKCKFLGNVIGNSVPSEFAQFWNQVTPENAGKWEYTEPQRDQPNWSQLDIAYNYAKANGFPFKHHAFIWGNQFPAWIENLPAEEQLEEIEEWIQLYCERYPDTEFIDVVNEPVNDPPVAGSGNFIGALGGNGATGYDWVIKSFEMARKHCPNSKLLLNEYNVINNDSRTNQYLTIVNLLNKDGLIDGIGVQGHRFELENATEVTLKNNLNKLGATGLPVYISEFDLGNLENAGTANDAKQLELYQKIFPVLWNHTAVHGITIWGYREGETWQSTAFLRRSNGTKRPALTWLETFVPSTYGGTFCYPITNIEDEHDLFELYPNPSADGVANVVVKSPYTEILVTDLNGRMISSFRDDQAGSIRITVPPGVYVVRVKDMSGVMTKKLVVQ